jgi:RNA polymerase sigma-70 factor (ECF subfamily)
MMSAVANDFDDDTVLVPALRDGDEEAFAWLVDEYDAALRRLARHYVSTQAVADEVVQETWLAVLQGIDRFEQRSSLKTWIFRILMNKARTRGVREHRSVPASSLGLDDADNGGFGPDWFRPPEDPEAAGHWAALPARWEEQPQDRLLSRETLDRVQDSIAALPTNLRQVLVLRDIEGWSADEVCNVLSLSPSNQRVLLHRARARVRMDLAEFFEPLAS